MNSPALRDRILIVDDSPTNVSILMDALEKDYEVSFANSGAEALALIADGEPPDLVLLDVMMPEMDGYEVCRRLKSGRATRDIPVIFVTAMDSSESESVGLTLGAEDYLTKPVNLGIARLRVRNLLERQRLYRQLELSMASAQQGLWTWDCDNDAVALDPHWAEPLGYTAKRPPPAPCPWSALVHPDDLAGLQAACAAHLTGRASAINVEVRIRNAVDAFVWVQILGRAQTLDGHGKAGHVAGTFLDISPRKRDEARLQEQQERLRTLLLSIPDIVLGFDTAGMLTELHLPPAYRDLVGDAPWQGIGYANILPAALAAALDAGMVASFEDPQLHTFECTVVQQGQTRHFAASVSRLAGNTEWPSGFMAVVRDVTEIRNAEQELRQLAFHDPLTGLANRRLLEDRLRQAALFAAREQSWAAVMLLDLDHFKALNDSHGHEAGDRLLIEVARRLRNAVREIDTVGRLGGDEFVVVLERLGKDEIAAATHAREVAGKITADLARDYDLGKIHYQCPASIGIRLFSGEQQDIEQLLEDADKAMYQAKQQSKTGNSPRS